MAHGKNAMKNGNKEVVRNGRPVMSKREAINFELKAIGNVIFVRNRFGRTVPYWCPEVA